MRLTILSSGSSGNAVLIASGATSLLIDVGLRPRHLGERLAACGVQRGPLPATAALLTHEHADHVCGAEPLAERGLPIYATPGTARALRLSERARTQVREVPLDEPLQVGPLRVTAVPLPHDAAQPVGYCVSDGVQRIGVLTDCGHPAAALAQAYAGCDALVLETNHDRGLLLGGPYPPQLKKRIDSDEGHLSNQQSAALLRAILAQGPAPRLVICAHLSKTNNRPELARAAISKVLGRRNVALLVAEQDRALQSIELIAGQVPSCERRQLSLPF